MSWQKPTLRILFESVLIIVSVLAAFWLSEWGERQRIAEDVQLARAAFKAEIETNIRELERVIPYHNSTVERIATRIAGAGESMLVGNELLSSLATVAPRGLQSPIISRAAWDSAKANGVLAEMDFETVQALARLYWLHEAGVESTMSLIMENLFSATLDPVTERQLFAFVLVTIQELAKQEEMLLTTKLETLKRLGD